jgi:hypothetical protein
VLIVRFLKMLKSPRTIVVRVVTEYAFYNLFKSIILMKTNMYTMLLLAFCAGSSLTALADSGANAWTGDGDGWRWEDPDNWEYDHVPSQYDSVVISGDAYVQVTEPDAECATVTIFQDATLFVRSEGSLNIYGYFFDTAPETSGIGLLLSPRWNKCRW